MTPEVVIGLFESETHRAVARLLTDWSKNQLIRDFIVCWTTPQVRFESVKGGETQATQLAGELDVDEEIILVHLGAWRPDEVDGLVSGLEASLAARVTLLNILAATQAAVREPVVVLAPPTLDARIPVGCLKEGRRTLVLSPEEREAPDGPNFLVETPHVLAAHIAAALVSLTGLWSGTEGVPVPLLTPDPHATNGSTARTVAAYTRIVDVGYLADHVAKRTLRTISGWPNPSAASFDSLEHDDQLLADLTARYLSTYREVLGPSTIEPLVIEEEAPPGLLERWRRFLRELWETIKFKPVKIAENLLRTAYDKAAVLTERITGGSVDRWDDPQAPLVTLQTAAEERYRTADGPVRDAWWDLRRLCIGMIDGSELPDLVPRARVTVEADRRLLIVAPEGYVPDPQTPSPISGVSPCNPRELDPECGADLSGLDPDALAELEAFVERRKSSVMWRVGAALAKNMTSANAEFADAEKEIQRLRDQVAEEVKRTEKRAAKLARAVWRFVLSSLILALAGIGGAIAVALTQPAVITALSCVGIPVVWLLVVLILAARLVHRRRTFRDETTNSIVEFSNQAVRAGIRRADVDRLNRRYAEYLDWADILGWLLHEPWSPPPEPDSRAVIDRSLTLPASVQRVVGQIEHQTLALLESSARASVFPQSWLDQIASAQQEHAARTYLVERESDPEPELTGRALPDPYGDTRLGDGTPRKFFCSAVRSMERRRELGEQTIGRVEADLRKRWPVDRIVSGVRPDRGENGITAPAPGWASEPPKLQALASQIRPSVVQIHMENRGGSGVVIGADTVLTNAHVVGYRTGAVDLYFDGDRRPIGATVEKVSSTTDLALIRFTKPGTVPAIALAAARPDQGETVLTIGYPLLLEGDPTLSWGYVSASHRSITLDRDDGKSWHLDVLQCSYASAGGASGSGVFDAAGQLVGVHCAGRVRDERADDFMSFAVPIDIVREFLGDSAEPVQSAMAPAAAHSQGDASVEPLLAFLSDVAVEVGDPIFGATGPWRPGNAPTKADVVFGTGELDPHAARLDARRGVFTVFVRSVTVLSEVRDAVDLES